MQKYYIHYQTGKVDDAIAETLAQDIIPQLRTMLEKAARKITAQPGFENSPYAREFAADLLIRGLAGFLAVSYFDDENDTARISMLSTEFVDWWFELDED